MRVSEGSVGGNGGVAWPSGSLLITAAVIAVLCLLGAAFIGWRVYRRIRGSRAWAGGVTEIRAIATPPGPRRDVTRLRRELREEVEAADLMLSRAENGRLFTADARSLVDELKVNAAAIDENLRSIESYADPTHQRSALDIVVPQVDGLIRTSYLARQTLLQTEAADRERRLAALTERVGQQAAALKIYRQGAHELDIDHGRG